MAVARPGRFRPNLNHLRSCSVTKVGLGPGTLRHRVGSLRARQVVAEHDSASRTRDRLTVSPNPDSSPAASLQQWSGIESDGTPGDTLCQRVSDARITSWAQPCRKLFSWAGGSLPGVESVGLRPPAFRMTKRWDVVMLVVNEPFEATADLRS